MDTVYLTREGFEKLRRELERLVKEVRPAATAGLEAARAHGDLFENAEFDAARENLVSIDRRIADLQLKLNRVQIIDEQELSSDKARILSRVTLLNLNKGNEVEYVLVDGVQADPTQQLISVDSPIGRGLLGKQVGDEVSIDVPSGKVRFRVLSIEPARGL